jgi:DedD protein
MKTAHSYLQTRFGSVMAACASLALIAVAGCNSSDQATILYRDNSTLKSKSKEEIEKDLKESQKKGGSDRAGAAKSGVWVVQVGAFRQKDNAEKLLEKLKKSGYPVLMQTVQHSRNGELHLVRLEPMSEKSQAQLALEQLQVKESINAQLLKVE